MKFSESKIKALQTAMEWRLQLLKNTVIFENANKENENRLVAAIATGPVAALQDEIKTLEKWLEAFN